MRADNNLRPISPAAPVMSKVATACTCTMQNECAPCRERRIAAAPRIPPDVLDDLRWQAEHPAAVVVDEQEHAYRFAAVIRRRADRGVGR